jgi:antibiotic biosynthesis monooxygenase (ABM) superfamily enzyme
VRWNTSAGSRDCKRPRGGAAGYCGVETIRPDDGAAVRQYVSIVRFDSYEHLHAWEQSGLREAWLARLPSGVVEAEAEVARLEGLEFWFQRASGGGRAWCDQ